MLFTFNILLVFTIFIFEYRKMFIILCVWFIDKSMTYFHEIISHWIIIIFIFIFIQYGGLFTWDMHFLGWKRCPLKAKVWKFNAFTNVTILSTTEPWCNINFIFLYKPVVRINALTIFYMTIKHHAIIRHRITAAIKLYQMSLGHLYSTVTIRYFEYVFGRITISFHCKLQTVS